MEWDDLGSNNNVGDENHGGALEDGASEAFVVPGHPREMSPERKQRKMWSPLPLSYALSSLSRLMETGCRVFFCAVSLLLLWWFSCSPLFLMFVQCVTSRGKLG